MGGVSFSLGCQKLLDLLAGRADFPGPFLRLGLSPMLADGGEERIFLVLDGRSALVRVPEQGLG